MTSDPVEFLFLAFFTALVSSLPKGITARSEGCLTTKIHITGDALSNPMSFHLCRIKPLIWTVLTCCCGLFGIRSMFVWRKILRGACKTSGSLWVAPSGRFDSLEVPSKGILGVRIRLVSLEIPDWKLLCQAEAIWGIATRYDKWFCDFLGGIHWAAKIIWLNWWHYFSYLKIFFPTHCAYRPTCENWRQWRPNHYHCAERSSANAWTASKTVWHMSTRLCDAI